MREDVDEAEELAAAQARLRAKWERFTSLRFLWEPETQQQQQQPEGAAASEETAQGQEEGSAQSDGSSGAAGMMSGELSLSMEDVMGMKRPALATRALGAAVWLVWLVQWAPLAAPLLATLSAAVAAGLAAPASQAALQGLLGLLLACPDIPILQAVRAPVRAWHRAAPRRACAHTLAHILHQRCACLHVQCSNLIAIQPPAYQLQLHAPVPMPACLSGGCPCTYMRVRGAMGVQGAWEVVAEGAWWRLLSSGLLYGGLLPLLVRLQHAGLHSHRPRPRSHANAPRDVWFGAGVHALCCSAVWAASGCHLA